MYVQLLTPYAELKFDLYPEDAEKLVQMAFRLSSGLPQTTSEPKGGDYPTDGYVDDAPIAIDSGNAVMTETAETTPARNQASAEDGKYKGFLLIRCAACGKRKGFNAKAPVATYYCECGVQTPLVDLVPVFANCECGRRWKYRTNETAEMFEINCLECGSPISLEYNARRKVYVTIRPKS